MSDLREMDLSVEERVVVLIMRQDQQAGTAIYNYARRYPENVDWNYALPPFREGPQEPNE